LIHLSLVANNMGSIQHLEESGVHRIGIVVLPWLQSHFTQTLSIEIQIQLHGQDLRQEVL